MPITTRKSTFTIFNLEAIRDMDVNSVEELLRGKQFTPIDDTPDVLSYGWTPVGDINDLDFQETIARGEYMLWAMRVDKRSIPSSVMRNEVSKVVKDELQRTGREFLSRERLGEIKEQVSLRLRSKMPPTPKTVQVVYDPSAKQVYVGSTSKTDIEYFIDLVQDTFGEVALPWNPADHAEEVLGAKIVDKLNAMEKETGNADYKIISDFLFWLWWKTETYKGGECKVPSGTYSAYVDGKIILDEYKDSTIQGKIDISTKDENNEFEDVKYSLWKFPRGIRSLSLKVENNDTEYELLLRADIPSSITVKTPPLRLNGEAVFNESPFLEKMYFLETIRNFINDLFTIFLKVRFSARWESAYQNAMLWLEASAPECERSNALPANEDGEDQE